jgi:hypothetical protein
LATPAQKNDAYLNLLIEPLRQCAHYRPALGGEAVGGVSPAQFQELYAQDPLYHWVGLDSELMYAAHKAAGGMTSIYRQLGIGCERLLRAVIEDSLEIAAEQAVWSYQYESSPGVVGVHTLDARIDLEHVQNAAGRERVRSWLGRAGAALGLHDDRIAALRGAVFEVRQGYKSADSKRQNADLRFGMRASNENYLPVIAIVSTQASAPVLRRYRNAQLLVLIGNFGADTQSTFNFVRDVVGYDLAAFFEANSPTLRAEFAAVLQALLQPE